MFLLVVTLSAREPFWSGLEKVLCENVHSFSLLRKRSSIFISDALLHECAKEIKYVVCDINSCADSTEYLLKRKSKSCAVLHTVVLSSFQKLAKSFTLNDCSPTLPTLANQRDCQLGPVCFERDCSLLCLLILV